MKIEEVKSTTKQQRARIRTSRGWAADDGREGVGAAGCG